MSLRFKHEPFVRLFKPEAILLDFHGTISERRWEDASIFEYVRKNVIKFVIVNWENDTIQNCLAGLRNESFEQHFRHKNDDAPLIDEATLDQPTDFLRVQAEQTGEFVLWQIRNKKETKETQIIERMVWLDGYKKKLIKTPLFDDVLESFEKWQKCGIRIYVISSLDSELMRLLFENTNYGDMRHFMTDYMSVKGGEKLQKETYENFSKKMAKVSPNSIVFITDSGQEAKAAKQAELECLLISRPGNRRIRSYYLTEFQYINKFYELIFIPRD